VAQEKKLEPPVETKAQSAERETHRGGPFTRLRVYLRFLGPGLVTGASDDDPSGIGTYSQTGALFGFTQLWIALFTLPLMAAVQEMCARIGLQTGEGLAHVVRRHYPRWVLYLCISLLLVANTINLGADLGAMAAAGQLILKLPFLVWLVGFTALILALQVWVPYARYAKFLRFLAFSLFAYVVVALAIPQDWGQIFYHTLVPQIQPNKDFLLNLVAVLGTTISPYLFFWQTSQEVEEQIADGKLTPAERKGTSKVEIKWMRSDVYTGMAVSNVVMWFIIITTASTLHGSSGQSVDSAAKAAEALRPVAGPLASILFAVGILGTGLLAVPILAGSAAYAAADTLKIRQGLSLKLRQAPGFYAIIALSTLVGAGLNLIGINPIKALYYTAVLNGLISPPLLLLLMLIANNRKIMARKVNGRIANILGWAATLGMTAAAAALLVSFFVRG
jgi:NRAMP (natural resistance-associated macrophage protein)-like metal ion transporter